MADDLWTVKKRGPDGKKLPSLRHGRGKRWRGRVPRAGQPPLTQLFERQADAEAWEAATRADLARGTYVDPDAGKVRLREYAETWRTTVWSGSEGSREEMERRFRLHVYPVLGDYELRTLAQRPSLISGWLTQLGEHLADNSIRPVFAHLSQVLSVAADDGLITRNPCKVKTVSAPAEVTRRVRPWTGDQVAAIRSGLSPRYGATVDAGSGLGLRQGEVFGLGVDDINWLRPKSRVAHVQRQVKIVGGVLVFDLPKGGKEREVPVADSTALRLSAHLERFPARSITLPWGKPGGEPTTVRLIFTNSRGGAITRTTFNRDIWKPALRAVGIEATRAHGFHMLRHTFASMLLANGVDIRTVAEYLGHWDPGFTLRRYAHLMEGAPDKMRSAIDEAYGGVRAG